MSNRDENAVRSSGRELARSMGKRWHMGALCFVSSVSLAASIALGSPAVTGPETGFHYSPNHNFDSTGHYTPGRFGFNLADVESESELRALQPGVKALVWIGQCKGVDAAFLKAVRPYVGNSKVFGFYLIDEPDPTGSYHSLCAPESLKAESDWIHAHAPGAKTFIVLMNLASSKQPSFINTYDRANSHIDLFGIDPYPCRTEFNGCDYQMIDRFVAAADSWGIPRGNMVPVYQAVGGGKWKDDGGGKYILPSASEIRQMLERWGTFVPAPVFDYAYSWGSQRGDQALEGSPDLQAVFARHNGASSP